MVINCTSCEFVSKGHRLGEMTYTLSICRIHIFLTPCRIEVPVAPNRLRNQNYVLNGKTSLGLENEKKKEGQQEQSHFVNKNRLH